MKFKNLQALRGIAAMLVFIIHLTPHGFGLDWFLYRFWWVGPAGVDLFFVISGFIVCYTAAKAGRVDEPSYIASGKFAIKRIVRVFPVYWLVLACAWLVAGKVELAPESMPVYEPWRYVFLLVMHNNKVMLAWTLAYEMFFYLMLALIILVRPKEVYKYVFFWIVVQVGVIGIAATHRASGFDNFGWVFTSPLILEFAAGCGVAFIVDRGVKGFGVGSAIAGIFLFAVGCYVNSYVGDWNPAWRALLLAPGAALVVYGAINIEAEHSIVLPKMLQSVGDASYSIYIWHQLIVAILLKIIHRYGVLSYLPGWSLMIFMGGVCLLVGYLSYWLVEKPSQGWIHRVLAKNKSAKVVAQS